MHIQWRWLDAQVQWNIKLFDIRLGFGNRSHWIVRLLWNVPVTTTDQMLPLFVRKSTFFARSIVQPTGGGAAKLVCEQCGAEYPYVANPQPCSFCAVMKESGITICIAHRTREWRWSDWGWAVKHNESYVGNIRPDGYSLIPTKFTAKHKAFEKARELEVAEWLRVDGTDDPEWMEDFGGHGYRLSVVPYPLKPVQPAPTDDAVIANIVASKLSPGIGAKPGTLGQPGQARKRLDK